MSGDRNSEASAIALLALAFHRSPARHADLMRGITPLPPSVSILLRLAGGTAPHELDSALESLAPAGELRTAALFFIEQVLFQRNASRYRVLGLNQNATPEQIKENHRLLMRLFHPDRESQTDERRQQFATRANLAYNTLRDVDQRSSYDATLKPSPAAAPIQAPRRVPGVVRHRMPEPETFWAVKVYPLLMRYLPQWVLAGTALVSVSIVGAVYVFNPPAHLPQSVASTSAAVAEKSAAATEGVVEMAAADATRLDEVVAQFERWIADAGQVFTADPADADKTLATAPIEAPVEVVEPVPPKPLPVTRVVSKPVPVTPAKTVQKTPAKAVEEPPAKLVQKPVAVALVTPISVAKAPMPEAPRQAAPPAASALPPPEPARPAMVAAVVMPPPPVIEPPPQAVLLDPNSLLRRFLEAYERGDTQTCMALLDEAARTDAGGKSELHRDYDALFRTTDLRHITVTNMSWSREGDSIRGEGQYRATMMRKGETLLRTQGGQVRIELIRRGNTAVINELYYLANSRS